MGKTEGPEESSLRREGTPNGDPLPQVHEAPRTEGYDPASTAEGPALRMAVTLGYSGRVGSSEEALGVR